MNENECLICKGELEKVNVGPSVGESEKCFANLNIRAPRSKGDTLVHTKKHYLNISEIEKDDWVDLLNLTKKIMKNIEKSCSAIGYKLSIVKRNLKS